MLKVRSRSSLMTDGAPMITCTHEHRGHMIT
jgi:hypothetical protein